MICGLSRAISIKPGGRGGDAGLAVFVAAGAWDTTCAAAIGAGFDAMVCSARRNAASNVCNFTRAVVNRVSRLAVLVCVRKINHSSPAQIAAATIETMNRARIRLFLFVV